MLALADKVAGLPQLPKPMRPSTSSEAHLSTDKLAEARAAHKEQDWDTAVTKYLEALQADPASSEGWIALAGALALAKRTDEALGVLIRLREADCAMCRYGVERSRRHADFAFLRRDPRYRIVVQGVTGPTADVKPLAKELVAQLRQGDAQMLRSAVAQGVPIAAKIGTWQDVTTVDGADALAKRVSGMRMRKAGGLSCDAWCCTLSYGRKPECKRWMINRVCFWPIGDKTVPHLVQTRKAKPPRCTPREP